MDFDYLVWIGAALFVLAVWIFVASEWGFVHSVDERGFTFRNLLGQRRIVHWDTLSDSAQQFTTFLPRIVVRLRERKFTQLHNSFAVLLRHRDVDAAFVREATERMSMNQIEKIQDLNKW